MCNDGSNDPMIVDVLGPCADEGRWSPVVGPETTGLTLPEHARDRIVAEAGRVLARCVPPTVQEGTETGLVVGYIQSGKTTSFMTLTARARDNGYRIVVIIAGTTRPLFFQTRDRLISALRLDSRPRNNPWRHISQPEIRAESHVAIRETLAQWNLPMALPEERRTILITVMKHHRHLQNLIGVLQQVNLQGVPTLIIDDEGDQAGLNTLVNQGQESTTYRRLLALKGCFPHHSYLQYTATPQAPLLISIVDVLSPSFAEILQTGDGYVGGVEFFLNHPQLVRDIPSTQIPTRNNPLNAPPPTLLQAIRLFFTGVAVGYITGSPERNCSMMVHPSQRTDPHRQFYTWVMAARDQWRQVMSLSDDDPDKSDLLREFRAAYDDLAITVANIPPFEQVAARLPLEISRTRVQEVNTRGGRPTPQITWGEDYSWILVGGQAMDRGFTVEGLTVTYMPRGLGIGNADTVQQRGRFFGYKQSYMGLCRVFVGPDVRRAFRDYVEHEEDVRGELERFSHTRRPLSDWRREFFLSRQFRPTRDNVISIAYRQVRLGDDWVYPDGPHDSQDAVSENRNVFERFRSSHSFIEHTDQDLRRDSARNLILRDAPLQVVHEELLTRYRVSRLEDSLQIGPLLRLIQLHLMDQSEDVCTVFLMGNGQRRQRGYENDRIKQLFQGRQYATLNGERVVTYPGDREVRAPQGLTVQMSYLDIGEPGSLIAENVPHIAVWIPGAIARDSLIQPQGGGN